MSKKPKTPTKNTATSHNLGHRHILQSEHWVKFQNSLGKEVIKVDKDQYSFVAVVEKTPVGKYLFVPYGPHLTSSTKLKLAIDSLKKVAKAQRAIFIRIEPTLRLSSKSLRQIGARKSKDIEPAETWVLDFPESKEQLLQKLPRRLRGYYNTHEKKEIEIIKSHHPDDIKHLLKLQKQVFKNKDIKTFSEDYLKQELAQDFAALYMAKHHGKIIAAILVFDDDTTRYYMQAASDKSFAKLNANGIITIQAILDAYEDGLHSFDFWGIAPDGASKDHPWSGFTAFKKMFDGHAEYYSGTYDIPISHFRFLAYKILRRLNLWLGR